MNYLINRLKEPSTQSAICTIALYSGIKADESVIQSACLIIGLVAGAFAAATPEGKK